MTNNIYTIKKGEKYPILIKLKNRDLDEPIDLTGSIIKFQIKDELNDEYFIIEKTIDENSDENCEGRIIDAINGKAVIRLNDEDYCKLIIQRVYYLVITWDIPEQNFSKVISSNGDEYLKFIVCHP